MAKNCEVCGKMRQKGNRVSHSNIKTIRTYLPNLQNVRALLPSGEVKTIRVCTSCIRSGKVQKAPARKVAE